MASKTHCDNCRKAIPFRGGHMPGWLQARFHGMHPGEQGPMGAYCGDTDECQDLDFCSWRCVAEYATARNIIQDELPGMG